LQNEVCYNPIKAENVTMGYFGYAEKMLWLISVK